MTRSLYRILISLHPLPFQDRFGEEMMWIFEIEDPAYRSSALLFDCFLSLMRQWLFHSSLWIFAVSFLINCFVFQKMIQFFVVDLMKLLAPL